MMTEIVLSKVESSMFDQVGYDDATWTLVLVFRNGTRLAYQQVSPELADEFRTAKSLGKFYLANIKEKFTAIGDESEPRRAVPRMPEKEQGMTDADMEIFDKAMAAKPAETREGHPVPVQSTTIIEAELTPETAIALPETKKHEAEVIIAEAQDQSQKARTLVVRSAQDYELAANWLKRLQAARDRAFSILDPIRAAVYAAYQVAQRNQKLAIDPIDEAIRHVKGAMVVYSTEQERIRQARLAEERRKAEEEALRRQQEESQRLTLEEAQDAINAGETERAEEIMANPVAVPRPYVEPAYVAPATPEVAGISTRKNFKVVEETINLEKFLNAVKKGDYPVEKAAKLLKPDIPALNKMAKSLETAFDVPGFEVRNFPSVASRKVG